MFGCMSDGSLTASEIGVNLEKAFAGVRGIRTAGAESIQPETLQWITAHKSPTICAAARTLKQYENRALFILC